MTTPSESAATPLVKLSAEGLVVKAMSGLRASKNPVFYRLKRGTELLDAMLEPVFHETKHKLRLHKMFWVTDELLACALLLVARLAEKPGSVPLARRLAGKSIEDTARYSDLRFANLIRSEGADELFQNLQRAVAYSDNKVEPFDLVRTVLSWNDETLPATRKRLMSQFHFFS